MATSTPARKGAALLRPRVTAFGAAASAPTAPGAPAASPRAESAVNL
jgi:hypothetical protein